MSFKKLITASFFMAVFFSLSAQKNYQAGWILTAEGDTLKGLIDYKNWEINPKTINFKSSTGAASKAYGPLNLKAFEVHGYDHYVAATLVKDMLPVDLQELEYEGTLRQEPDTVFLRTLVNGSKVSLYELVDIKPHYFIKGANGDFEELLYRRLLSKANSTQAITYPIYQEQLRQLAMEDHSLQKKIAQAAYKEEELKNIVVRLNGTPINTAAPKERGEKLYRLFAGAGLGATNIRFEGESEALNVLQSKAYLGPVLEGGIDLYNKRGFHNLMFRLLLKYSTIGFNGEAVANGSKRQYLLKMNMITPAAYILYSIVRTQDSKLYLGVGGGYNLTSYSSNRYVTTDTWAGASSEKDNYLDMGNWVDFHAKLGYTFKDRFEVKLDRRVAGTFTNFIGISAKNVSTNLVVGIRF